MTTPIKRKRVPFSKAITALWRDPTVSVTAKAVLQVIKGYGNAMGDNCRPCAATIGRNLGISRSSVFRAIRELEERRIVKVVPQFQGRKQTASIYLIDDEHFARFRGVKPDTQRGCQKRDTIKIQYQESAPPALTVSEPLPNVIPMPSQAEAPTHQKSGKTPDFGP